MKNRNEKDAFESLSDKQLLDAIRPIKRGDCADLPRPCPFVSCRYNTFLEVNQESGKLKIVFDECESPSDMKINNCVLDIVDKNGSMTLEDIGKIMNITRERVRQIADAAVRKLRPLSDGP